jgi:hypothetical protein
VLAARTEARDFRAHTWQRAGWPRRRTRRARRGEAHLEQLLDHAAVCQRKHLGVDLVHLLECLLAHARKVLVAGHIRDRGARSAPPSSHSNQTGTHEHDLSQKNKKQAPTNRPG